MQTGGSSEKKHVPLLRQKRGKVRRKCRVRLEDSWKERKVGRFRCGSRQVMGVFFFLDGVFSSWVNLGCGARGQCQGVIGPYCLVAGGPWRSSLTSLSLSCSVCRGG